jgi:hypothetical protein
MAGIEADATGQVERDPNSLERRNSTLFDIHPDRY